DIVAQDPNNLTATGPDPLVPGHGASQVGRITNDRDTVYSLQVLRRAISGGIVHDDDLVHLVRLAQDGLQTLHRVDELVVHGNDESNAGQWDHTDTEEGSDVSFPRSRPYAAASSSFMASAANMISTRSRAATPTATQPA